MTSIAVLPSTRLVRGAAGAISHQFTDSDGEPSAPPSGTLTVSVTRSDGTAVASGAATGDNAAPRSTAIDVDELTVTDWLTAVWSLDGTAIASDTVEVVGGTLGSAAQIRGTDQALRGKETADLIEKRRAVEDASLAVLNRAVFERFNVERIRSTGRGPLVLAYPDLIEVAWVRVWSGSTSSAYFSNEQIASIPSNPAGLASIPGACWPYGDIDIAYRFGMLSCPAELTEALRKAIRHQFTAFDTGMPRNAASAVTADGFSIGLAGPGNENWSFGDTEIDRVVNRYKWHAIGIA